MRVPCMVAVVLVIGVRSVAQATITPLGARFEVAGEGSTPDVSADPGGSFVVAWEDKKTGLWIRRYDPGAVPLVPSVAFAQTHNAPAVARDSAGDFVVVWRAPSTADPVTLRPYALRFDVNGMAQGSPIEISSENVFEPDVTVDGAGNFVVALKATAGSGSVNARRFDHDGLALGPEFQVSSNSTYAARMVRVGASPDGRFVVVWPSLDGTVLARRYASDGTALSPEFAVSSGPAGGVGVASDDDGGFVVVWAGESGGVLGRRYDGSGMPLTAELQIGAPDEDVSFEPEVAVDAAHGFVVVWQQSEFTIVGRRYFVTGDPDGDAFVIDANDYGGRPKIAADGEGRVVVAWESAAGHPVFVRRYQIEDVAGLCFDINCPPFYDQVPLYFPEGGGGCFCVPSAVDPGIIEVEIIDLFTNYGGDLESCYQKGVKQLVRTAPFALSKCVARAGMKYDRAAARLVPPTGVDLATLRRLLATAMQDLNASLFCNQAGSARPLPSEYGAGWLPTSAATAGAELGAGKVVRKQNNAIGKCFAKGLRDHVRSQSWLVSDCLATARAKAVAAGEKLDFTAAGFGPRTGCYTDGRLGDLAEHVEAVTIGALGEAFPGR